MSPDLFSPTTPLSEVCAFTRFGCKGRSLRNRQRSTHHASSLAVVWLTERLVAGLFGIAFHLPPLPLCILIVGSCYSLTGLQSSRLILFASCFFIPLFVFYYYNNYFYHFVGHCGAFCGLK